MAMESRTILGSVREKKGNKPQETHNNDIGTQEYKPSLQACVSFCSVMGVIIIMVVAVLMAVWQSEEDEMKKRKECFYDGERLEVLLHKRELGKALLLVDTLHRKNPHDPQLLFR